jgi:hypothetical protein
MTEEGAYSVATVEARQGLVDRLDGKTVITADHGELLYDRVFGVRVCSHRPWFNVPQLREVPWLELPFNTRRKTTTEAPATTTDVPEQAIEDQLEALGYR